MSQAAVVTGAPPGLLKTQFDRDGYLSLDNITSAAELAHIASHRPIPLRSIHFWIPLQTATIDNGCMSYIPGSHLLGRVRHTEVTKRFAASSDRSLGSTLAIENVDAAEARPCPVAAGGVAVHHPLTFHCAGANRTDEYRRAWILHFGAYGKWRFRLHPTCIADRVKSALSGF